MKTEGYQEMFAEYLRSIVWLSLERDGSFIFPYLPYS